MVDGSHSISYDDDDIDDGYYIDDVFINSISVTRRVRNIQPLIVKNTDIFCLMFSGLPMGLHLTVEWKNLKRPLKMVRQIFMHIVFVDTYIHIINTPIDFRKATRSFFYIFNAEFLF